MANKTKPLTLVEQHALRQKAKNELERLESVYTNDATREKIHSFKEKFGICEIVYKVILEDHQLNKKGKKPTHMKVDMTQVPYVLTYAGYDFDQTLLTQLFGSEDKIWSLKGESLNPSLYIKMRFWNFEFQISIFSRYKRSFVWMKS